MTLRLIYLMFSKFLGWMVLRTRSDATKDIEILVLRHQLAVLRRRTPRPRMRWVPTALCLPPSPDRSPSAVDSAGFFYFTTQCLQGVLGFTPLQAGVAFLPMSAVNFAVALLVTSAVLRLGSTPVLAAGVAATLASMAWLSRIGADSSYPTAVALPMALIGIGSASHSPP